MSGQCINPGPSFLCPICHRPISKANIFSNVQVANPGCTKSVHDLQKPPFTTVYGSAPSTRHLPLLHLRGNPLAIFFHHLPQFLSDHLPQLGEEPSLSLCQLPLPCRRDHSSHNPPLPFTQSLPPHHLYPQHHQLYFHHFFLLPPLFVNFLLHHLTPTTLRQPPPPLI